MKALSKQRSGLPLLKRLGVAALVAVSLTVWAKPPPQGGDWGTVQFANIGDEPRASGEATLTQVQLAGASEVYGVHYVCYYGELNVNCRNLIPGATYSTPAGTFKADRRGEGKVKGKVAFDFTWWGGDWGAPIEMMPYAVEVVRLDRDGSSTPILTGDFVPPRFQTLQ